MHKLDRNSVPVPPCLVAPDAGRRYTDLHGSEKNEIRETLLTMQKQRCAYCERRTGAERDDGHVEHFRKQAGNEALVLTWSNMYWSCQDEKTCGKHKDKCDRPAGSGPQAVFDADELIDPCVHDPDAHLQFFTDGTVRPREGLDPPAARRASETVRVFQLADSPYLRKSREDAVQPYVLAVDSLLAAGLEVLQRYLESVNTVIDDSPFCTVIQQYVRGLRN